jgi:hypothetical protein
MSAAAVQSGWSMVPSNETSHSRWVPSPITRTTEIPVESGTTWGEYSLSGVSVIRRDFPLGRLRR